MSKLIFAALAISAAHADAETLAVQAIDGLKSDAQTNKKRIAELECELADLKKTNDKMKADCADAAKQRAEDLVKAAVADGRIAPKDEDKQNKLLAKIEAGDTFAEEILAQMPKLTTGADLTKPVITAGAAKVENATGFERGGRS
jgi:lipopolysaccharide biosynthesis regulator YciM